jgi:hypothetical protein
VIRRSTLFGQLQVSGTRVWASKKSMGLPMSEFSRTAAAQNESSFWDRVASNDGTLRHSPWSVTSFRRREVRVSSEEASIARKSSAEILVACR